MSDIALASDGISTRSLSAKNYAGVLPVYFETVMKARIADSPDDAEMLSDLIVAAVNEANANAKKEYEDTMAELTGGLNIPGLGGMM